MNKLLSINSIDVVPADYRLTPIGLFLKYNNLNRPFDAFGRDVYG